MLDATRRLRNRHSPTECPSFEIAQAAVSLSVLLRLSAFLFLRAFGHSACFSGWAIMLFIVFLF